MMTSIGYMSSYGGSVDAFVCKRSASSGGYSYAVPLGGTSADYGYGIALDGSNNVLTTGYFNGLADFDPSASLAQIGSTAFSDAFICKLDVNFNYLWACKIGSSSADQGNSIKTDALDNVYTTGNFGATADFDPGAANYSITPGSMDVFVLKLTSAGTFVWAKNWGSPGGGDEGKGIALDANGNVYTTGRFTNTCDFDPGAGSYSLTTAGSDEIFVHKLSCTLPSTVTVSSSLTPVCVGNSSTKSITLSSTIEASVGYSWSAIGASVVFSPTTGTTTSASYTASTNFTIVVTATNACGTTTTEVQTINPYPLPSVSGGVSPTLTCDGGTATFYGIGASSYTWSPFVPNSVPMTHYYGEPTYTVIGSDANGCINTATVYLTVVQNPTISVSGKTLTCLNKPNTLTASGATTYTWQPGSVISNSINAQPSANTTYTINAQNSNGCFGSTTFSLNLVMPQTPEICEVTVDSLSQFNNILWDKTPYNNVDSFIVYREVSTNIYRRIGAQDKNALSLFVDTARSIGPSNGDPNITYYKYKLQIRDTCGNYSTLSPYHNTVYFITNSTGTYFWNTYNIEFQPSTPVTTFDLVRDNNGTGVWTLVGSTTGTTLNDPAYSSFPNAIYRVYANGFNCTPTSKTTQQINRSKSNVKNNFNTSGIPTGIITSNLLNSEVNLAPNPATSELTISFTSEINKITKVSIMDVLGKTIYNSEINEGKAVIIPIIELSNGIYFVKIEQGKNYTIKKFVKE